jgi:hypothetical protein
MKQPSAMPHQMINTGDAKKAPQHPTSTSAEDDSTQPQSLAQPVRRDKPILRHSNELPSRRPRPDHGYPYDLSTTNTKTTASTAAMERMQNLCESKRNEWGKFHDAVQRKRKRGGLHPSMEQRIKQLMEAQQKDLKAQQSKAQQHKEVITKHVANTSV